MDEHIQDICLSEADNLEKSKNLRASEVLAMEIVENLEAALDHFRWIIESLEGNKGAKD